MADIEMEIESRLKRISENDARISALVNLLWHPDGAKNPERLREEEMDLRQANVILRREVADLRTKLPK